MSSRKTEIYHNSTIDIQRKVRRSAAAVEKWKYMQDGKFISPESVRAQLSAADAVRAHFQAAGRVGERAPGVYVQTFGCQQNEADSERLIGTALSLGYEKAASVESADLIIYNTCAVREHAELKALSKTGQLKHIKTANPELLVGLWG